MIDEKIKLHNEFCEWLENLPRVQYLKNKVEELENQIIFLENKLNNGAINGNN